MSIYKAEKMPNNNPERTKFLGQMITTLKTWGGSNDGMFGDVIDKLSNKINSENASLAAIPQGAGVTIDTMNASYSTEVGNHPMLAHCKLSLLADVSIDKNALTQSVTNVRSSGCFGQTYYDDSTASQKRQQFANGIQAILDQLINYEPKLAGLQKHESDLNAMIDQLGKLY